MLPSPAGKRGPEWEVRPGLARIFHEFLSRDREDGRVTGQPQGLGSEAYFHNTSQGVRPEDDRKDDYGLQIVDCGFEIAQDRVRQSRR